MKSMKYIALLVVGLLPTLGNSQGVEDQKEAASLLSHYVANLEAISSFDVLIESDLQWAGEKGALEGYTSKERLIVDQENKRCCSVRKLTRTRYLPSSQGAVEKNDVVLRAVVSDGKQAWGRNFPSPVFPIKDVELANVMSANDSILVHSIGILPFPFQHAMVKHFRQHIDYLRFGKIKLELTSGLRGNPAVRMHMPYTEDVSEVKVIVLDEDSLVPTSMSKTYIYRGVRTLRLRESYTFIEKDGVFLPRTISGEQRKKRTIGGARMAGMDVYDATLHWFTINGLAGDGREDIFTPQIVQDANKALSLLSVEGSEK